eukprot:XP_025014343.1 protein trichome birefringence-like 43 [Ricinus communis]
MGSFTTGAILLFFLVLSLVHHSYGFLKVEVTGNKGCDIFEGSWVRDESYPLYDSSQCPFIEKEFDCLKNGRPDKDFLKYRWQPTSCTFPRFNGGDLLSKLEGKSIMFVGDSLSLNQWQSLTCMLHVAVPNAKYTNIRTGGLSIFSFPVNLLIFNSWHWWLHTGRKQPWKFIQEGNSIYQDMDRLVAYEKALSTWAEWVDTNVNPTKTIVFFQGVSPDHNNGTDWGEPMAKYCEGQNQPVFGSKYPAGEHPAEVVVEKVISGMSNPVHLLNVTALSQLRKDGHPSVYGHGGHNDMDCSHWCLAGVPDTWNQLFYALLLQNFTN